MLVADVLVLFLWKFPLSAASKLFGLRFTKRKAFVLFSFCLWINQYRRGVVLIWLKRESFSRKGPLKWNLSFSVSKILRIKSFGLPLFQWRNSQRLELLYTLGRIISIHERDTLGIHKCHPDVVLVDRYQIKLKGTIAMYWSIYTENEPEISTYRVLADLSVSLHLPLTTEFNIWEKISPIRKLSKTSIR